MMSLRPGRASPRAVLLGALLFVALGVGLYALGPWVLPVRILEGPMIQEATEAAVTLIWYTTRPLSAGECEVVLHSAVGQRTFAVATDGTRNRVRIDGLVAGQAYPYLISLDSRTLAEATLHTNKPADQAYAFIVFGDSGRGTRQQYQLARLMRGPGIAPDFILHVGDLIYSQGERSKFKNRFFVPYRHLLAEINFWPTLGNHEVPESGARPPYLDVFELPENGPPGQPPERNYWFDYASARIAVIDSTSADEAMFAEQVAPWLAEVFSGCDATWKFVSLHHPPYTAGSYEPDLSIQRTLVPVFEAVGVDIVFAGHDHMYQRMLPLRAGQVAEDGRGVAYIITGAGGASLYDALPPEQQPVYLAALDNQRHSFTYVQIDGHELRLQQIDINGQVIDEWAMGKMLAPSVPPQEPDAVIEEPTGETP